MENLEIFEITDADIEAYLNDEQLDPGQYEGINEPGYYYWFCAPGALPDCDPIGPFDTGEEAYDHAVAVHGPQLADEDDLPEGSI